MIYTKDLIHFLKSSSVNSGFVDGLKVHYRPLICPFDDLLNWVSSKPLKVFDIGCGSGQFALLLAEFTGVTQISGIEIDEKLVHNARALLEPYGQKLKVDFNTYDGQNLPNSIADHDVIFLIDVFHHVPKEYQVSFLRLLYSKMRPGALLVIKDINAGSPFVIFNKVHDLVFAKEIGNEWPVNKLAGLLSDIGFNIESLTKKQLYVYPHFTLVLKK